MTLDTQIKAKKNAETLDTRYGKLHPHGRVISPRAALPRLADAPLVRVAAVAPVNQVGQILVGYSVKRRVWDIPQGVVEDGETVVEAALRELAEETSLTVGFDGLVHVAEFSQLTEEFGYPWRTELFMLADGTDMSRVENREPDRCLDLGWYAPIQIPQPRGLSLRVLLTLLGRG